jgi:rod shape-determining protein MreC
VAFGSQRSLPARGASPGFRFTLYAILSITLMFLDQRSGWLDRARYLMQGAAYPLQLAVNSPSAAWGWLEESFETRDALRAENLKLKEQQRALQVRMLRYEALARENATLRGLEEALPAVAQRWLVGEVVNVEVNSLRQRVLINRGTTNGVFRAQAVVDEHGLLGQTTRVGPWSAEVILITDPEHAVPVQVQRTGLRTIAVGAGNTGALALPYIPGNADVRRGDLLVTSGLGGVFPEGYPVARVAEVHRDAVQPLAQVRAEPLARIDSDREVMLLWFQPGHPAAPVDTSKPDLSAGRADIQPRDAPPKPAVPKPAVPAAPQEPQR